MVILKNCFNYKSNKIFKFPLITKTFIQQELLEMEFYGVDIIALLILLLGRHQTCILAYGIFKNNRYQK